MKVRFSKKFRKQYKKSPLEIQKVFNLRLEFFISNPNSILLRNHALIGKMQGLRSINITGDVRALYEEKGGDEVVFIAIGTHSELYR